MLREELGLYLLGPRASCKHQWLRYERPLSVVDASMREEESTDQLVSGIGLRAKRIHIVRITILMRERKRKGGRRKDRSLIPSGH